MLGLELRAIRVTWSVLLTIACAGFLFIAQRTVVIFLLALFFAYLLAPIVSLVNHFAKGKLSRTLSLTLVYAALIAILAVVSFGIAARASEEAANLIGRLPDFAESAKKLREVTLPAWMEPLRGQILDALQEQISSGLERALPILRTAIAQLLSVIGNVGFAVLIPILSFFFLKDAEDLREGILQVFGRGVKRPFVDGLLTDLHEMLGQYIRAIFLLSVATFVAYALFFRIAGVPYAALLATIAAVLEFIPVIGPLTAGVVACVVALVSGYYSIGIMIVFFLVYRLFQDYVLQPFLLGTGLALHPLLIVFGALAGEQVGGIFGMIFSVPVLATLRLIYVRATREVSL